MSSHVLGVVPARLGSTRLPDKPLHPLLGRPLIEWVWRRAREMTILDEIVVATDSDEVGDVCRRLGARVEMTSAEHPSGTDRVAEVVKRGAYSRYDVIVNIQGDEPLMKEEHMEAAVRMVRDDGWDIGTCAAPLMDADAREDPNVVKVVRGEAGRALYFSRSPVPYKRAHEPTEEELRKEPFLRHIGIYAYSRDSLERWVGLEPTPLERLEKLEQLRPLEAGFRIGVAVVDSAEAGVDTAADAARMEERLARIHEPHEPPFAQTGR